MLTLGPSWPKISATTTMEVSIRMILEIAFFVSNLIFFMLKKCMIITFGIKCWDNTLYLVFTCNLGAEGF